jgi:gamma-glutamyltranspeptidase
MHFALGIDLSKTATTLFLAGGLLLDGTNNLQASRSASVASGKNGIVVAGEKRAADIGTQVLEKGGNAADATTAALLALSVTKIGAFTIGGEASVIFYDAHQQKAHVLWAQGAAPLDPQAISWYLKNGMPASDIRTAAVPAVVDLCVTCSNSMGPFRLKKRLNRLWRCLMLEGQAGTSTPLMEAELRRAETGRRI